MSPTTRHIGLALVLFAVCTVCASAAELSDTMPAGTLLYLSWPGDDAFDKATKDTAWGEFKAEPEVVRFREQWHSQIWPAIDKLIRQNLGNGPQAEGYEPALNLLWSAWKYPSALGLAGVEIAPDGPKVDLALVIRAGAEAKKLTDDLDAILKIAMGPQYKPEEAKVGEATLREITLPNTDIPLRYGVRGQDFVISIGTKIPDHWSAGTQAKPLTTSARFASAMKPIGASSATPVCYLDLKGTFATLEEFQPIFAGQGVPILRESGGLQKLLEGLGLASMQSLSAAMRPQAGGFVTTVFLHAPNIGHGPSAMFVQKPLTDNDLKTVPRDVSCAVVCNFDLAGAYRSMLSALEAVSPQIHTELNSKIEQLQNQIGVNIERDLLGSFADTWSFYDAPANGGLWFTGIVGTAELKAGNKLDESLDKIVKAVAGAVGEEYPITVREDTYRGQKIRFVNIANAPVPFAPAWTTVDDHCIFALFPQMVRTAIDQLTDNGPTLLDNPDFQRGRKQMPPAFSSISYTDTRDGVRFLYSLGLPAGVALMNLAQGKDIPLDASLLPSSKTLTKHLFGNVTAAAPTKDGILKVSYGAIPIPVPAVAAGGGVAGSALAISITLPALARARELAKRTASMSNLKQIALACMLYSQDHHGKLPPTLETLTQGDHPLMPKRALKSPRDSTGADVSYVYVAGLTTKTPQPSRTLLAYENPDTLDTSEGLCVAFLDGHVEWMVKTQFDRQLEKTKERTAGQSK